MPKMEEMLNEKKQICIASINPKAIYESFEIKKVEGEVVYFKNGNSFKGPNISKILKGSEIATIFICTLGHKVDEIIIRQRRQSFSYNNGCNNYKHTWFAW